MDTLEMERFKQNLPKISAKLADKKERLISKMKELRIFKNNEDVFQTLAESNNFKMLEYLKELLRIDGYETIVQDIEGKSAHALDYSENSKTSADNGSDSLHDVLESKSDQFGRKLQEMRQEMRQEMMKGFQETRQEMMMEIQDTRQEMMKAIQEMKIEVKEARAEARKHNEGAKKTESKLWELISKLEKDKDERTKELKDISLTGIDEARSEALQHKYHDRETKYNHLLDLKKKMGTPERALGGRNARLGKEIAQLKPELFSMQVSNTAKGKMYIKLAAPTRQKQIRDDKTK